MQISLKTIKSTQFIIVTLLNQFHKLESNVKILITNGRKGQHENQNELIILWGFLS